MNAPPSHVLEFGEFRLDLGEQRLFRSDGAEVSLTPRVFATLRYLVEHAGRTIDKKAIMDAVWSDCLVEENNLAQAISKLRQVFGEKAGTQRYIATIPGRGYRFVAEVVAGVGDPGPARAETPSIAPQALTLPGSKNPAPKRPVILGLLILLLLGVAFFLWRNSLPLPTTARPNESTEAALDKSIAVLPFTNLSSDPDTAYFAEGMKDEILTRLSKIAALKVISRTSTEEFAGKPHNAREIARRLGVTHLLEGSVQKAGETVRVTVQLIHAPTDTHVWAESYDRKLTDVLQVESEIAQRIASTLATTVSGAEKRALTAAATTNVQAHEAYLRGRYFWNKRTAEGFTEAVAHFTRAVELDPGYAQAYAGLADAIYFRGAENRVGYEEVFHRSKALLEKALTLDDSLADAHASLGLLAMNSEWDWSKAEQHFKRALELNSNYATAHQWYGEFLAYMGRFDEAISQSTRARALDPLSLIINTDLAKVLSLARRYDDAIAQYQAALKLDPEFPEALALLGMTYSNVGRHDEAIAALRKIEGLENNAAYLSWLAYVYGAAGRAEESRQTIERVTDLSRTKYVSPYWLAIAWAGSADKEQAYRWLETIFAERAPSGAISLKVNPVFDSLRPDPRFADFLRRAKLP
jgi:TolB-like protein/DNA-binding winged helix-turn-helix (wHTH) protein/Tfp pilus assembly protein PilF